MIYSLCHETWQLSLVNQGKVKREENMITIIMVVTATKNFTC